MKNEADVLNALRHYEKQPIGICGMCQFSVLKKSVYKQRVNLPNITNGKRYTIQLENQ